MIDIFHHCLLRDSLHQIETFINKRTITKHGFVYGGLNNLTYGVDIEQIRLAGILQRIAVAYFLAVVCEI